jgi:hypothetical protein
MRYFVASEDPTRLVRIDDPQVVDILVPGEGWVEEVGLLGIIYDDEKTLSWDEVSEDEAKKVAKALGYPDALTSAVACVEAMFSNKDGDPVPQGDPTAKYVEITETDTDGTERRTYGEIGS